MTPSIATFVCTNLACLLLISAQPVRADEPFSGMDNYVHRALKFWAIPGLAIAVVKHGEVVLARGYGICEVGAQAPITADTLFPLSSSGKSFVATAIALLVEEGKLAWDDPVIKHLPEFELADRDLANHLTLRDLLCHRTGLRRADLLGDGTGFDAAEIVSRLKHLESAAPLRTRLTYSNHMYTVLGEVVTRVAGEPWEQFVKTRILEPLEMASTTYVAKDLPRDRLARRHWRSDAGIVARPINRDLYSSANDMTKWLQMQLGEGTLGDGQLIKPETVREMHALQFSVPVTSRSQDNVYEARFYGTGLGWFVQEYRGRKIVVHQGAWGSIVALLPEEGLGIAVLSNMDLESLPALLMFDVIDAYLIGPTATWNPQKWNATWLKHEPPGIAYRPREEAKSRLQLSRANDTRPAAPLERFSGSYESALYGRLLVRHENGRLAVTFGEHTTDLVHWQDDSFYARAPTRLTFDWLLSFQLSSNGQIDGVTVKHIGWDREETDQKFVRQR